MQRPPDDGASQLVSQASIPKVVYSEGTYVRLIRQINRENAERGMAAISLGCHLYRFEKGTWPTSLNDVHSYLPDMPIDPFGNGDETLRYALVKRGLPDGSDRPLVFDRERGANGLFFRVDEPLYGYNADDGSHHPFSQQKHDGQFRDVASWVPPTGKQISPTTQPLQ